MWAHRFVNFKSRLVVLTIIHINQRVFIPNPSELRLQLEGVRLPLIRFMHCMLMLEWVTIRNHACPDD